MKKKAAGKPKSKMAKARAEVEREQKKAEKKAAKAATKAASKAAKPKKEKKQAIVKAARELPERGFAEKFTDSLRDDAKSFETDARSRWIKFGARALEGIKLLVPEALGQSATGWLKDTFGRNWQSYRRAMLSYKLLSPVLTEEKMEGISEGNAYRLLELPEELQTDKKWIAKAGEEDNEVFAENVYQERKKRGLVYEKEVPIWEIFKLGRLPETFKEIVPLAMQEAAALLASEGYEINLETQQGKTSAIEKILGEFHSSHQHLLESIDVQASTE